MTPTGDGWVVATAGVTFARLSAMNSGRADG
jgi:hypothetical protein